MQLLSLIAIIVGLNLSPAPTPPLAIAADASSVARPSWETDGVVSAIVSDGTTAYIGGSFTSIGPLSGSGVALDIASAQYDPLLPQVTGSVHSVIPDGQGGWFIGGYFTAVGGEPRNGLAHIRADRTLDPSFDPNLNGWVYCLVLSGSTIYAGGSFMTVNGGIVRNSLAAFDIATGSATAFDPDINASVYALALRGDTLYVGGHIYSVTGGAVRQGLAAFDTTTSLATPFDPGLAGDGQIDPIVYSLILDGTTLYAGGNFSMVNGIFPRSNIVAFDTTTGGATGFAPNLEGAVHALALRGTTLYVGGVFVSANGTSSRLNLAAFDTTTGAMTPFAPTVVGRVTTLAVNESTLFVGGEITDINKGTQRHHLLAFSTITGLATSFDAQIETAGRVSQIAIFGDTLYVGGTFSRIHVEQRLNLAAIDLFTGKATAFAPTVSAYGAGFINALALSGTTLYVGGYFNTVNGDIPRNRLAAFDTRTGAVTSFNPDITDSTSIVYTLALSGGTLYAGGYFNIVNRGTPRHSLAAFDTASGIATPFDPDVNGVVESIVISGTTLYAGGRFEHVNGGTTRSSLAAFDTGTGIATPFDPPAGQSGAFAITGVTALALSGTTLYAGGGFNMNSDTDLTYLAAFDTTTGVVTPFSPNLTSTSIDPVWVSSLAVSDTTLYVGGSFTAIDGADRQGLAAFNTISRALTAFAPARQRHISTLYTTPSDLIVGLGIDAGNTDAQPSLLLFPFDRVPIASTGAATDVTRTTASLNGAINGRGTQLAIFFEVTNVSGDYSGAVSISATPATAGGANDTYVTGQVDGLIPKHAYYYRVVATGLSGNTLGSERTFTTNDPTRLPLIVRQ